MRRKGRKRGTKRKRSLRESRKRKLQEDYNRDLFGDVVTQLEYFGFDVERNFDEGVIFFNSEPAGIGMWVEGEANIRTNDMFLSAEFIFHEVNTDTDVSLTGFLDERLNDISEMNEVLREFVADIERLGNRIVSKSNTILR